MEEWGTIITTILLPFVHSLLTKGRIRDYQGVVVQPQGDTFTTYHFTDFSRLVHCEGRAQVPRNRLSTGFEVYTFCMCIFGYIRFEIQGHLGRVTNVRLRVYVSFTSTISC